MDKTSNGQLEKEYRADIIMGVDFSENENDSKSTTNINYYTISKDSKDVGIGGDYLGNKYSSDVNIITTIHYTVSSKKSSGTTLNYMKLTKVSAKFKILDPSCTISNKKVRARYAGYDIDKNKIVKLTTTSWYSGTSKELSSPCLEITTGGIIAQLYGDAKCTVKRKGSSWTFQCTAYISDTGAL